jgi:DNA-binding transcriptional ArsR family regulator
MRRASEHPSRQQLDLHAVLHALSDPVRMQVVRQLANEEERGWGELDVPVAKSTLSHHLKVLRRAGVINVRQDGQRCFVSLRSEDLESRFPGVLSSILSATARPATRR